MVIVVMGVSGSGKTTVGRALAAALGWEFADADAWHSAVNIAKMHGGTALTDDDRRSWLEALNRSIRTWVASARNVVLACSALRRSYRRALRAGVPAHDAVRFVFLSGTYEDIDRRLRARPGHFMPDALLRSQFETLEPPSPSEAVAVAAAQPIDAMVGAIIAALGLPRPGSR